MDVQPLEQQPGLMGGALLGEPASVPRTACCNQCPVAWRPVGAWIPWGCGSRGYWLDWSG